MRRAGQYGSANDPETSCAVNPHQLDFMASPPHALTDVGAAQGWPAGADADV